MNIFKQSKLLKFTGLILFSLCLFSSNVYGQDEEPTKKQVVIIKKTIDSNGVETIEKTIKEGQDAEGVDIEGLIEAASAGDEVEIEIEEGNGMKKVKIKKKMASGEKTEGKEKETTTTTKKVKKWVDENGVEHTFENQRQMISIDEEGNMKAQQAPPSTFKNTLDLQTLNINIDSATGMHLQFSIAKKALTVVDLFDPKGKKIFTDTIDKFEGRYDGKMELPTTPGIYILSITQDGKTFKEALSIGQ